MALAPGRSSAAPVGVLDYVIAQRWATADVLTEM
jgi:hypothetical protein